MGLSPDSEPNYPSHMAPLRLDQSVGWPAFRLYVLAGGLLSFGLVAAASIGLFVIPFGVFLFGLLIAYAPDWRDRWGAVAGVGAVGVLIGLLNLNSSPCPEVGWVVVGPGEGSYSCGGLEAWPWLVVGALIVATALVMYRRGQRVAGSS